MPTVTQSGASYAIFNGGTITLPLVIDLSADNADVPLTIKQSYTNQAGDFFDIVNTDSGLNALSFGGSLVVGDGAVPGQVISMASSAGNPEVTLAGGSVVAAHGVTASGATNYLAADGYTALYGATSSGALPTTTLSSGIAAQIDANTDRTVFIPITYNPTAGAAATCKVELSPDDMTFTTLTTDSVPLGIAADGTVRSLTTIVPSGWYVKVTVTNATIGTVTYY